MQDIQAFEFISYANLSPDAFIAKLTDALRNVLGNPFAALYPEATAVFQKFRIAKRPGLIEATQADFEAAMVAANARGQRIPADGSPRAEYLIRRLLGPEPEIQVFIDLKDWLEVQYP